MVDAVGEGVTQWKAGDRVIAMMGNGGLATEVLADAARLFPLPDGVSFETGASLLMTYGTNMHGLLDRGHLQAGDTLLVLGAAGGVGLSAVELGKAYGAKVIAAVSTEEKAQVAREHGADDVVIYPRAPFDKDQSKALAEAFKAACGPEGANVIYDIVGGDYSEPALRSIAWEGRFCVVGFPAGIARLPLNLTLLKSCDVCGVFWAPSPPAIPRPTRPTSPSCSSCSRTARSIRAFPRPSRLSVAVRRSACSNRVQQSARSW